MMFNTFKNNKITIGIFIAICFVLFYKLDTYGVAETSEAPYAETSRVMYLSGDYIHPYLMGVLY
jgi:4-amino-4-deoxy-L-arabinose transferase-like glycosyltransferase